MKKLMAIVLALVLALSCTLTATAEAVSGSKQTTMQIYINPDLLQMLGGDDEMMQMANTILNTFNGMSWTITSGDNVCKLSFAMNNNEVYDYTVSASEDALHLFSSFFPNTAIKLDFNALQQLIMKAMENEQVQSLISELESTINATVDVEQMAMLAAAAMEALPAYMEDVEAVVSAVMQGAEVAEDGSSVYVPVTNHHVADLFTALITRLQNDQVLLPVVDELFVQLGMIDGEQVTTAALLNDLLTNVQSLKAEEQSEIASFGMYGEEDGSMSYEVTLANIMLVALNVYEYEGLMCADTLVVLSSYGTEDWQATYEAVVDGTNADDLVLGLNIAYGEDASEVYQYAQLYMVTAGSTGAISIENSQTGIDTAEWAESGYVSLDISSGGQEMNLGGVTWDACMVEKLVAPSLDDKYVLDVLALPTDLLLNGLPVYFEKLVNAAPEFMQLYENLLNMKLEEMGLNFELNLVADAPVAEQPEVVENTYVKNGIEDM